MSKYDFKRYELQYKLTKNQYQEIIKTISNKLIKDEYGKTTIQSLYYDTDTFLLIRNSIEKPLYKEKLRARSYGLANKNTKVFLELKKKYDKVVYKRRVLVKEDEIEKFLTDKLGEQATQIEKEIAYVCRFYKTLKPKMLLLYDRTAYYEKGSDLRITFDENIGYRTERLNLHSNLDRTPILEDGEVIMEIKTGRAYPMWLVKFLNGNKIYKSSFSKYGTAYTIEQQKIKNQKKVAV